MSVRVAINGFGRMGRLLTRVLCERFGELEIVVINDRAATAECAAHLLTFDSVHGRWGHPVGHGAGTLTLGERRVAYTQASSLESLGWGARGVDIALECTGAYRTPESLAAYYDQGVQKVIVACPVKQGALNVVYGVNHTLYDAAEHRLLTAASCTTNCLAPVVKVMHEQIGIAHGVITTIHDITNTQSVVDAPHKDLRRARANGQSLIPTTTGSATAITQIYPELTGRLNGLAVRVPLLNASLTDCVFEMTRPVTREEVNGLLQVASETYLQGILGYEERPLVSVDYKDDPRSAIIDALSTMVVHDTCVKLLAWYDNEIGYVNRMAELTDMVARSL